MPRVTTAQARTVCLDLRIIALTRFPRGTSMHLPQSIARYCRFPHLLSSEHRKTPQDVSA